MAGPDSHLRPAALRDAATVMLLRDGGGTTPAIEVFMLRRNLRSVFVAGAYVFPGGGVDGTDRDPRLFAVCAGRTDAEASAVLGIDQGGLAFWVAAVRECFEEAGVLLARDRQGRVVSFADRGTAARFEEHRRRLNSRETTLVAICEEEGLLLDVEAIHYFSHWITPLGAPRRYDTRFFVCAAPPEQVPLHDDGEVIANLWLSPGEALRRNSAGEYELIRPTYEVLRSLAEFTASVEILDVARTMGHVPAVQPRMGESNEGVRILLPGDDEYARAVVDALRADMPPGDATATPRGMIRGAGAGGGHG